MSDQLNRNQVSLHSIKRPPRFNSKLKVCMGGKSTQPETITVLFSRVFKRQSLMYFFFEQTSGCSRESFVLKYRCRRKDNQAHIINVV